MDSAKAQLADKLKGANNVLVTVSRDPSVDQLAACIGLTLLLNKLGKHAAAVFSGNIPSTLEFLQPEDTLEKNTDSLRDFIIALDKSKADKLRYKVEDNVVRIFITPYKTSISQADLEFSQGDFNVDVVVALGVRKQEDLDEAITAHGRILHDATVTSINTSTDAGLGSINWHEPQASSLSELVTELTEAMGGDLLDSQIATALLTGIVAETERFSNERTSSQTMNASAKLMAAGANQQLVATKLEEPSMPVSADDSGDKPSDDFGSVNRNPNDDPPKSDDGTLDISHNDSPGNTDTSDHDETHDDEHHDGEPDKPNQSQPPSSMATLGPAEHHDDIEPAHEVPNPMPLEAYSVFNNQLSPQAITSDHVSPGSKLMTEAPSMGGMLTANTEAEDEEAPLDPLNAATPGQLLNHDTTAPPPQNPMPTPFPPPPPSPSEPPKPPPAPAPVPAPKPEPPVMQGLTPPPPAWVPPPSTNPFNPNSAPPAPQSDNKPGTSQTLIDLERSVGSPHLAEPAAPNLDKVRDEVNRALENAPFNPEPIQALNAQPLGQPLHPPELPVSAVSNDQTAQPGPGFVATPPVQTSSTEPSLTPSPTTPAPMAPAPAPTTASVNDPTAPPPVPPPIPFQFGSPGSSS